MDEKEKLKFTRRQADRIVIVTIVKLKLKEEAILPQFPRLHSSVMQVEGLIGLNISVREYFLYGR